MDGCHCERCAPLEWARAGLAGRDALPADDGVMIAADAGRVRRYTEESAPEPRLSGRDWYVAHLTRTTDEKPPESDEDEEPDEEEIVGPDGEPLSGRDTYLARLSRLCDEYSRDHQRRLSHGGGSAGHSPQRGRGGRNS